MLNAAQGEPDDEHGTRTTRLVSSLTSWLGSFPAIVLATGTVLAWLVGGVWVPQRWGNDTYQLVIGTVTSIVTFVMVFIIQNSQNRGAVGLSALADAVGRGGRRHRWAAALAGALGIIIGVLAAVVLGQGAHLLAVLAGTWAVLVGALDTVASVQPRTTGTRRHRTTALAGVLAVIAGLVILARPHLGTPALADVLGTYALVSAIALLWAGWNAAQAFAVMPSSAAAAVGARRSMDTPGPPAGRPGQRRRSCS